MIINSITRFTTKSIGAVLTLVNLSMLTYFLDVYQLAVWGVANSIIYVFSQFANFGYSQYIEKFFPNLNSNRQLYFLSKFIKTIFYLTIIWFLLGYFLIEVGFFQKYKIENVIYLVIIICLLTTVESTIEVLNKYFTSIKKTLDVDISNLFIFYLLRVVVFYLLLINEFSVYYLLFFQLTIRFIFLLRLLKLINNNFFMIINRIIKSKILINNLPNFSYTYKAFIIKTLLTTFLNLVFLILSYKQTNRVVAIFSLCILIINSTRPVLTSISGLASPIISKNIILGESNLKVIQKLMQINSLVASSTVIFLFYILNINIIKNFLEIKFLIDIRSYILISVFASTIGMFYLPNFYHIMFSGLEVKMLKFISINYLLLLLIYFFTTDIQYMALIVYMIFEFLILIFVNYMFNKNNSEANFKYKFSYLYPISFVLIFMFNSEFFLKYLFLIFVLFLILIFIEISKAFKKINNDR